MFGLSNSVRVFLAVEPVDLRMSFNGLHGVVLDRLEEDPCSGALFVFTNGGIGLKRCIGRHGPLGDDQTTGAGVFFEIMLKKERDNATTLEVIQAENSQLKTEVRLLREKVQYLLKKLFGRSPETLNPDQMELLLEELQDVQEALEQVEEKLDEELPVRESRRGKRKPLKERIPEDLPVERVVIVPEVKAAPDAAYCSNGFPAEPPNALIPC